MESEELSPEERYQRILEQDVVLHQKKRDLRDEKSRARSEAEFIKQNIEIGTSMILKSKRRLVTAIEDTQDLEVKLRRREQELWKQIEEGEL